MIKLIRKSSSGSTKEVDLITRQSRESRKVTISEVSNAKSLASSLLLRKYFSKKRVTKVTI